MILANKNYICLSKLDIYENMNKSFEKKDFKNYRYFQKLISNLFLYEESNHIVSDIYVPVSDLSNNDALISRQTLLNAYLYANIEQDYLIASDIEKFLSKKRVSCEEIGELSDYVLMHGMDINEYYDGENLRLIYKNNEFTDDYIYKSGEKLLAKTTLKNN